MKQTPWTMNNWRDRNPFAKAYRDFQAFRQFNKALKEKPNEVHEEKMADNSSLFKAYEGHPYSFRSLEGENNGVKDVPVQSTAIEDVHFDPSSNTTTIRFKGGTTEYSYNTTEADMKEFIEAPSKGRLVAKKWNHNPRYYKK